MITAESLKNEITLLLEHEHLDAILSPEEFDAHIYLRILLNEFDGEALITHLSRFLRVRQHAFPEKNAQWHNPSY